MTSIPSLSNPPNAPRKGPAMRPTTLPVVRPLYLPPTPPPPAPKKEKKTKRVDLTPIPFEWEHETWMREAELLANSGFVRIKFLSHTPATILEMENLNYLRLLKDLYFPSSQPQNMFEEAFLSLMRDLVDYQIETLTHPL